MSYLLLVIGHVQNEEILHLFKYIQMSHTETTTFFQVLINSPLLSGKTCRKQESFLPTV